MYPMLAQLIYIYFVDMILKADILSRRVFNRFSIAKYARQVIPVIIATARWGSANSVFLDFLLNRPDFEVLHYAVIDPLSVKDRRCLDGWYLVEILAKCNEAVGCLLLFYRIH